MTRKIIEGVIGVILFTVLIYVGKAKIEAFYFNKGNDHYNRQQYQESARAFNDALKINLSNAATHYMLANAYSEGGKLTEAIAEYKYALKLDPNFIMVYPALASAYWNKGMQEEAVAVLKQAEEAGFNDEAAKNLLQEFSFDVSSNYLAKAVDAFMNNNKDDAFAILNRALEINPSFTYGYYTLAVFYYNDNKFEEAEKALNNAIRINNKFWIAYKLLGDIYFQKLQYEKAIDSYQTALALGKEDAVIYNDIGLALIQLERYREATTYLEKAFSRDPGNVNIHYSLASAYRDAGLFSKALAEYTAIATYNSTYPYLFNDIGEIYRNKGERVVSLEAFNRELVNANERLRSDPDNPVFLDSLAGALNGLGKYGEAKVIIEKAIKLNPRFRQAYLTLARIYEDSGHEKEALEALKKAKQLPGSSGFIEKDIRRLGDKELLPQQGHFFSVQTVYLKNGRKITGRIKDQDDEKIVLEILTGNTAGDLILYQHTIDRIE